jgi:chromosome segregation ATPase
MTPAPKLAQHEELAKIREIIVGPDIAQLRATMVQHDSDLRALETALAEMRDQHERKLDALKRELRRTEENLRAELRGVAERLDDQKTDRQTLAAMLRDLATRLETNTPVTNLLEELTTPAKD